MRKIIIEVESGNSDFESSLAVNAIDLGNAIAEITGEADVYATHTKILRTPNGLCAEITKITGEADVYTPHTKILRTPDGLRHARVIIVSSYLKSVEQEKAVVDLITKKRAEWDLFELRFVLVDVGCEYA